MQTFLPYDDFRKSLECLDYRRLGKQRVESYQIWRCLKGIKIGWANHPITKMWKGYEDSLAEYTNISIDIWKERGYKNTMEHLPFINPIKPHWFGNEAFHSSHRAALLFKDFEFYKVNQWKEDPILNYVFILD